MYACIRFLFFMKSFIFSTKILHLQLILGFWGTCVWVTYTYRIAALVFKGILENSIIKLLFI